MQFCSKYILIFFLVSNFYQVEVSGQSEKYTLLAKKIKASLDSSKTDIKQYIDLYREWSVEDKNLKEEAQSWIYEGDRLYYENKIIPSTNAYIKAKEISKKDPFLDSLTTYGYIYAAYNYNELNLFDQSIDMLQEGIPYAKTLADSSYLADFYSILGSANFHIGKLGVSINYFDSCLIVETLLKDTLGMLKAVNNIGKINIRNGQTAKAINYYKQALELGNSVHVSAALRAIMQTNMGHALLKNKDYDAAKTIFKKSYLENQKTNDTLQLIYGLVALSEVSKAQESNIEGKKYIEDAIDLITDNTPPLAIANLYNHLGSFCLELEQLDRSKSHFSKALSLSKSHSILMKHKEALKNLIKIAKLEGEFENASKLSEELNDIQERIIEDENTKAIEEINARYKYEKQMEEIQSLEHKDKINSTKIESLNMQRIWMLAFFAIALIIGLFLVQLMIKKHGVKLKQKEAQIKAQQVEIDDIQSIVSMQLSDQTESHSQLLSQDEVNARLKTPLTNREYEILVETYNGLSNKEIADKLFLSVNTIKFHLKKVYNKLDVSNRIQALKVITR